MSRITAILVALATLWQLAQTSSFKLESMGMMVKGNEENKTTIAHRRPITNVKAIVPSCNIGQLPHLPTEDRPRE